MTAYWGEAIGLLMECARLMASRDPGKFMLMLVAAIALAGGCWWLCTHYTKLWNLRYHVTFTHHVLCGVAALLTLVFTVVFMSLAYAKDVAARKIGDWHEEVKSDREFHTVNYAMAYEAAKSGGLEQFDPVKHPPPGHPNSQIPLNHQETRLRITQLYANRSVEHFRQRHPLLSRLIWPAREIPMEILLKDMQDWFAKNPSGLYMLNRGVDLAANQIEQALEPRTPVVVKYARTAATLLFLLVQAVPFGLIGYAAYHDVQTIT
jgi:hypothetical protein